MNFHSIQLINRIRTNKIVRALIGQNGEIALNMNILLDNDDESVEQAKTNIES